MDLFMSLCPHAEDLISLVLEVAPRSVSSCGVAPYGFSSESDEGPIGWFEWEVV